MDRPSDPESLPADQADQATDTQEQQLSDINLEIVELVEEIDYQDREISILRDFSVQQGLLLNAAARFSAYCHSRINRLRNKLNGFGWQDSRKEVERLVAEIEVHDIRKNIVRLAEELEALLTDRDAVGERLRATTEHIASVIEQIQKIENEPPDSPQAENIGRLYQENPVEQLGKRVARVTEWAKGVEDAKEMTELIHHDYGLEKDLDSSQKRIKECLQQADDLKRQLKKRELECQEHQAELERLRSDNGILVAGNDRLQRRLQDEGTSQDVELTKLRDENRELRDANDLLRSEIEQLENHITALESRNGDDGVSVGRGGGKAGRSGGRAGRGGGRIQQGGEKPQHENEDLEAESPKQLEVVVEPKLEVIIEPRKQAKGRAPSRRRKQLDEPNSPRRSKRLKE